MVASTSQLLKRYGHLPQRGLSHLADSEVTRQAQMIDSDLLVDRKCGCPDFPDEEVASSSIESIQEHLGFSAEERDCAEALKITHQRMLDATGRGSFPPGCHQDIYPHADRHCTTYWIDRSTFGRNYTRPADEDEIRHLSNAGVWSQWGVDQALDTWLGKPILDVAMDFVRETYRRVGNWLMPVESRVAANIVLLSRYISGSTIGIGWFNDGRCNDRVESHYDSSWKPSLYRLCLLLGHEIGHNLNLQHEFSNQNRHHGVMSYSWPSNFYGFLTGDEGILPRDPSWGPLARFFGGEPIPQIGGPDGPRLILPSHEFVGELMGDHIVFRGPIKFDKRLVIPAGTELNISPIEGREGRFELRSLPPV